MTIGASFDLAVYRLNGHVRWFTDLGCYPIFYLVADGGVLCADCVENERPDVPDDEQENDWRVVGADVNWEDPKLHCDHCSERIESAYGGNE